MIIINALIQLEFSKKHILKKIKLKKKNFFLIIFIKFTNEF